MKLISGEKLIFADKIKKTNMFEWTQERTLVITNFAIYNIHKKDIKRQISIKDVGGISKTVPPSKVLEFTIHVPSTYDYRFESARRDIIVDVLKRLYLIEFKTNCPIYHIEAKDLKGFTTTEKDMKNKASRIPTKEYLSTSEDLIKLNAPTLTKQDTTNEDSVNNYAETQAIRALQVNDASFKSSNTDDDEDA